MSDARKLYEAALKDYRNNLPDDALRKLQSALALSPDLEDAYEALAVILYNQKRYDEAIARIKEWIRINPHSVLSHTNLSRCYVAKRMIAEAEHEQAEARRLTWKSELKEKKQSLPKTDVKELIQRYKQIIELDPKDVLGYFSLGQTYLKAGMPRDAVDTFEQAIQVHPKHSSSYLGLGQALEALGDHEKAKRIYETGIRVAEGQGDIMTLKKMESRKTALR